MQNDLQVWQLILSASWMVKMVMLVLLAASISSWMIIFRKRQMLAAAEKGADKFEERFWSGTDLTKLYDSVSSNNTGEGLEQIFESGFNEFSRMREQGRVTPGVLVEAAQRGMRIALVRETNRLENHLSYLATVGSTSPYIGLFGTVWGIMTSFQSPSRTARRGHQSGSAFLPSHCQKMGRLRGSLSPLKAARRLSPSPW